MSALLLAQAQQFVRAQFTKAEVATVEAYGGQFSGDEVDKLSYNCPAILITVLGSRPAVQSERLRGKHARMVQMAAFVATKHAKRETRMALAMAVADKLATSLSLWRPDSTDQPLCIAPLEDQCTCENLYGRAIDRAGQALWLVSWMQCVQPTLPLPAVVDWLSLDIASTARSQEAAAAAPAPLPAALVGKPVVSDAIDFAATL